VETLSAKQTPGHAEPAWDIAKLFPNQGDWSEEEYLDLSGRTNRFVEMVDGRIEVLDTATSSHQRIVASMCSALNAFVRARKLGELIIGAYPVRLRERTFLEPDLVFMLAEHAGRLGEEYAEGADLVVEVPSKDRDRDLEMKRVEYAQARIPEYWIVDPREQRIMVLRLAHGEYEAHGEFTGRDRATSVLLPGFEVETRQVFAAVQI
jgi:Uma2 family endonuclease